MAFRAAWTCGGIGVPRTGTFSGMISPRLVAIGTGAGPAIPWDRPTPCATVVAPRIPPLTTNGSTSVGYENVKSTTDPLAFRSKPDTDALLLLLSARAGASVAPTSSSVAVTAPQVDGRRCPRVLVIAPPSSHHGHCYGHLPLPEPTAGTRCRGPRPPR